MYYTILTLRVIATRVWQNPRRSYRTHYVHRHTYYHGILYRGGLDTDVVRREIARLSRCYTMVGRTYEVY